MSQDLGQLLPPGVEDLSGAWAGDYEIFWSIYIKCANRQKLRNIHIPALEALIGQPHGGRGWVIEKEDDKPDELRLIAPEPLPGPYNDAMLTSL